MNGAAAWVAVLGAVAATYPVVHLLRRRRRLEGRRLLMLCLLAGAYPLLRMVGDERTGVQLEYAALAWIAPLYCLAVLDYLREVTPWRHYIDPALTTCATLLCVWALPGSLPGYFYVDAATGDLELGLGAWLMKVFSYVLVVITAALGLSRFNRRRTRSLYLAILVFIPVLSGIADAVGSVRGWDGLIAGVSHLQFVTTGGLLVLTWSLSRHLLPRPPMNRNSLLHQMAEASGVINGRGLLTDCNAGFLAAVQKPESELLGHYAADVLPEPLVAVLQRLPVRDQTIALRHAGADAYYMVNAARLDDGDLLVSLRDCTAQAQAQTALAHKEAELNEARAQLDRVASTDALTGLANRRLFSERLTEAAGSDSAGLILIGIDHFRTLNDTHGDAAGDAVLNKVAAALRDQFRTGDVLARIGDTEFAALLGRTDSERLHRAAERLRDTVRRAVVQLPNGVTLQVTLSVGAVMLSANALPASLMREADRLLHEAKQTRR